MRKFYPPNLQNILHLKMGEIWKRRCLFGTYHKEYHNIFHLSIDQLKLAINGTKAFTLLAASRVNQTANLTPWQFPKKSQGTEPCKKEIPFGTDRFWNLLFLASRCMFGRFQQIQALSSCLVKTHLWTLRKEPFPLPRYPKTLQHGNLPKAKTSCSANKATFTPHLHRSQLAILQLKKTAKLISPMISAQVL